MKWDPNGSEEFIYLNMGEQFASRKTLTHSGFHYAEYPQESLLLRFTSVPVFPSYLFNHHFSKCLWQHLICVSCWGWLGTLLPARSPWVSD